MQTRIDLPKAFSVRDDNEFFPIQHLVARLNPKLVVRHVGTGRHTSGGPTVFWGLVHMDGQPPTKKQVETALKEAGYDFGHNVLVQAATLDATDGDPFGRPSP